MSSPMLWISLIVFIAICLGASGLGAIATTPEIDGWYKTIEKPAWNPPGYVFGPVWTTLYIMMGVAAWLVWKREGFKTAKTPLVLLAGALMVPYLAWVSFASVLNFTIWKMN